jgi:hypothetical protein
MKYIQLPDQEIISHHKNNVSIRQLSKLYGVSQYKIKSILDKNGLFANPIKLKFNYNQDFILNSSDEKYYF